MIRRTPDSQRPGSQLALDCVAAGSVATVETATPAAEARAALADNDADTFLERRDALVVTGPTGTNVNDLTVFVVSDG